MLFENLPVSEDFHCELLQRVRGFLHQRGYAPHRTLEISVELGVVVVQGRVPSYYLRQIAVECIKRVAGVTRVFDRIEVDRIEADRIEADRIEVEDRPGRSLSNNNIEGEQKSAAPWFRPRIDLPDMAQTSHDAHQKRARRGSFLSSAKG